MGSTTDLGGVLARLRESQDLQIELLKSLLSQAPRAGTVISRKPDNHPLAGIKADDQRFVLAPVPGGLSNFELHYSGSVKNILSAIMQDLSSHRHIHVWDDSIERDLTKKLAAFAKLNFVQLLDSLCFYYGSTYQAAGAYILSFSAVDEVSTVGAVNRRLPFQFDRLFRIGKADESDSTPRGRRPSIAETPRTSRGRIICTQESIADASRVALILLHTFCLRLQDEDFTFIRSFIERHLAFQPFCEDPYRSPGVSPATASSKSYKRVSVSFHLPHFLLVRDAGGGEPFEQHCPDREFLGLFGPDPQLTDGGADRLYWAASSVLLTLAVPDPHASSASTGDHPQGLWSNPEAIWAVLIFNGPKSVGIHLRGEPVEFLTPLAQFVRGVCAVICSQRMNLYLVLERLKERLRKSTARGDTNLFDDKSFTKSVLYHWMIKTCHELYSTADTSIRFIRKFESGYLHSLRQSAHPYEKAGLAHWTANVGAETAELESFQADVNGFREHVRELRDAIHGASALLESRTAVLQGERIRLLTFLTILYLPMTTVASLYSMQVLPRQATLASFFGVLVALTLATILAALDWRYISAEGRRRIADRFPGLIPEPTVANVVRFLAFEFPKREALYGAGLLRPPVGNREYTEIRFSWANFVSDIGRLVFLPLWVIYLSVLYLLSALGSAAVVAFGYCTGR
ncbi:MAG: hypothetical protein M1839_004552 [Geoglossum umbratile]|nr:MAG: hypothetical protein M1839_004552 [Geoglossum umbratile]